MNIASYRQIDSDVADIFFYFCLPILFICQVSSIKLPTLILSHSVCLVQVINQVVFEVEEREDLVPFDEEWEAQLAARVTFSEVEESQVADMIDEDSDDDDNDGDGDDDEVSALPPSSCLPSSN